MPASLLITAGVLAKRNVLPDGPQRHHSKPLPPLEKSYLSTIYSLWTPRIDLGAEALYR